MAKKYFTDKTFLVELLEENEENVKVKIVDCRFPYESVRQNIGKVLYTDRTQFYKITLPYDLNNPLMVIKPVGKCYCGSCGKEMQLSDDCIRCRGMVFCCQSCFETYLDFDEGTIDGADFNDEETIEVPMFDYKGE